MTGNTTIYVKKPKLPWRTLAGEAVIVDIHGNMVLQLNDVGRHIWERINGATSIDEVINSIADDYDVEPATARADTHRFISTLIEKGLIHEAPDNAEHCRTPV